jgi:hypothetical protein
MSWHQLLILNMNRGQYLHLGKQPLTPYNWLVLQSLAWEVEQARVTK